MKAKAYIGVCINSIRKRRLSAAHPPPDLSLSNKAQAHAFPAVAFIQPLKSKEFIPIYSGWCSRTKVGKPADSFLVISRAVAMDTVLLYSCQIISLIILRQKSPAFTKYFVCLTTLKAPTRSLCTYLVLSPLFFFYSKCSRQNGSEKMECIMSHQSHIWISERLKNKVINRLYNMFYTQVLTLPRPEGFLLNK